MGVKDHEATHQQYRSENGVQPMPDTREDMVPFHHILRP
jgi:hypothetical protein